MADNDFLRQQQAAVERMREMNARSQQNGGYKMPPVPNFVKLSGNGQQNVRGNIQGEARTQNNGREAEPKKQTAESARNGGVLSFLDGLDIPFLSKLKTDKDMSIVIGLALILFSEGADKMLLLALLYILM